jgi:hypothetical protein
MMTAWINEEVAGRLEEAARLLQAQGTEWYRVYAFRRAAASIRRSPLAIDTVFREWGIAGLKELPGVGESIARAIRELLTRGHLPMLDRLRREADAIGLLASVPGIGRRLAQRLHDELGIETLADLEAAAHDGRLDTLAGFGDKRLSGIRDSLAYRLGRVHIPAHDTAARPPVSELLDVDQEYRAKAASGQLRLIAPRRFNPQGEAWLPILHTTRGSRTYAALYSNTAHAHKTGKTRDWVVLYHDDGTGERQDTVITATRGPLQGHRVVAGREKECLALRTPFAA